MSDEGSRNGYLRVCVGKNGVTRDGKSKRRGIFERVGVGKRARVAWQYIHVLILGKRREEWKGN